MDTLLSSRVILPLNPGSIYPAVECISNPTLPSELFPSNLETKFVGISTYSNVLPRTNWFGCKIKGCLSSTLTNEVRLCDMFFTSILIYLSNSKTLYGFYEKYFNKFKNLRY